MFGKWNIGCSAFQSGVAGLGLHKEYAERGALLADAQKDSPETGTGKHMKRMRDVVEKVRKDATQLWSR